MHNYFGDWIKVIDKTLLNSILVKLQIEYNNKNIYPSQKDVFKAFKKCKYNDLKIVFLGQDPYPQKDVATGILFGNKEVTDDIHLSPSLQIIKESVINFEIPHYCINFDPTLESWAQQGILMLNSALTVEENKIGSHTMLWRPFIAKLLENISKDKTGIIYVLFGQQAKTFKPYINKQFNFVLEENHPAYYARTNTKMPNTIFQEVSMLVKSIYGIPIEWFNTN